MGLGIGCANKSNEKTVCVLNLFDLRPIHMNAYTKYDIVFLTDSYT